MWGFNVSSSNATITSYKATSFPGGLTETATSDSNNIQRVDPYITVHNLTHGITYIFTVTAVNSFSESIPSGVSNPVQHGHWLVEQIIGTI